MEIHHRSESIGTIDEVFGMISGRFQVFSTLVHAVGFCMGGFLSFALPLVEFFPQFQCWDEPTQSFQDCPRAEACASSSWRVNWDSQRSIHNWISDMDLYCADKWRIGLFGSMYYFGYLIGSVCFVNLSDIYGRKVCTRVSYILHTVGFMLIIYFGGTWMPNARYVLIFCVGFVGSVRCSVSYTTGCEFLQKKHQIYSSAVTQMINACVPMFLAIYFWHISKHWIYFFYFTLSICIVNCVNSFFIPESPRWLFSQEKYDEARTILNKVAVINGKARIPNHFEIVDDKYLDYKAANDKSNMDAPQLVASPLTTISRSSRHRYNLTLIVLFWFVACIMNYIMNFYVKYIKTDVIFLLILLAAIAEFVSKTLNGIIIKWVGFKKGTLLCIFCCSLSSLAFLLLGENQLFVVPLIFACKLSASATFASMYFSCPTLFESKIAVTAYNICNISGKIGAVFAPMIAEMPGSWPMVVFFASSVVSYLLIHLVKV